ncbi:MAG: cytochrome d ubiquinol oxidase subunit II [Actinomycetes bacterium]
MDLNTVWFILIAVLWSGYFVLEGFDFGVGILLPVVAKNEAEKRAVITTLGPIWDGNEVWLLVAGGATFAAFPAWYATMFSGFYLPLLLILVALIIRGVAFEYRSKRSGVAWRKWFDWAIIVGSFLPALLWGVAFANIVRGIPLRAGANNNPVYADVLYDGGFFNLLNPYALVGGLTTLALFLTHGATFLSLKTKGTIRERAAKLALPLGLVATVLAVVFLLWTQLAYSNKAATWILLIVGAVSWLVSLAMGKVGKPGWAFLFESITLAGTVAYLFWVLFPNVFPASNDSALSLTIHNASSTPYTLQIMTVVAVIFTPLVLIYQAYTYWVFRKRVGPEDIIDPEIGSLDLPHEPSAAERAAAASGKSNAAATSSDG